VTGTAAVPKYYFDIYGVRGGRRDEAGEELPNNEAAWREGTRAAGELLKDIDGKFRPGEDWVLEVTDEHRKPLYTINISAKESK